MFLVRLLQGYQRKSLLPKEQKKRKSALIEPKRLLNIGQHLLSAKRVRAQGSPAFPDRQGKGHPLQTRTPWHQFIDQLAQGGLPPVRAGSQQTSGNNPCPNTNKQYRLSPAICGQARAGGFISYFRAERRGHKSKKSIIEIDLVRRGVMVSGYQSLWVGMCFCNSPFGSTVSTL